MTTPRPPLGAPVPKKGTIPEGAVILMRLSSWDGFEPAVGSFIPAGIRVQGPEGSIGFCEVYESAEAARKVNGPDAEVVGIRLASRRRPRPKPRRRGRA